MTGRARFKTGLGDGGGGGGGVGVSRMMGANQLWHSGIIWSCELQARGE